MDKGYVQNTIFELLSRLGIGYEKLEHSPIITMKEGSEIAYKLGSTSCKNLFLCNKRQEYFMLMLPADKKLSAKNVARQIGSPHLSFASAEDMERLLHTYPGAVSVLSLIYDKEKRVQLLIDKGLMNVTYIGCHPCTNTCSLKIKMEDILTVWLPATHAMLHYYFRTKENLFNKVFEEKAKQLADTFLSRVDESLPFLEKIKCFIEAHFDLLTANPELPLFIYREILTNECGKEICRKTLFPNFRLAISLLDRSLQEEIKKGTVRPVKAEDLMVSAISLNIFVFVANPLIQLFVEEKGEEYHQYMERRKQENVEIILSRLRK